MLSWTARLRTQFIARNILRVGEEWKCTGCVAREKERILKEHEFFLTFSDKHVQLKEKYLERNLQADLASPSKVIFMISKNLF
jgi:hypothetical protein